MCVDHKISCACAGNSASFQFKDDILPVQAVERLYCPSCSPDIGFNPSTMLSDNGWIIEYNMDLARFLMKNILRDEAIDPEYLFDEGYATWRGVYPNDHIDSARERGELIKLAKTDPKRYVEALKSWGIDRMERLAREGWRKANEREGVAP